MPSSAGEFVNQLVAPLSIIWMGLLVGAVWQVRARRWRVAWLFGGLFFLLTIFGNTQLPAWLLSRLEAPYANQQMDTILEAEAILVLGGGIISSTQSPHGFEAKDAIDRFLAGIDLIKRGKAKVLVFGGGATGRDMKQSESQLYMDLIKRWQLTEFEVLSLGICANTHEEANQLKQLKSERGWKKIILVTSANHLRRSEGVFRTAGVDVIPIGCDFQGTTAMQNGHVLKLFPASERFQMAVSWLHEVIGWRYYRLRGWISDDAASVVSR